MFNSILKFFTNYYIILFLLIGVGLFSLGLVVNSVLNWTWILYFFILLRSLVSIIWFLPFEIFFTLIGLSLMLYTGLFVFLIVLLVYNWFRFSNR